MTITFRRAKRSGVKLWVGLAGPSGCGKTFSALLMAEGIQEVDGGDIFVIETENRRSEHYADRFNFQIGELKAPFNPKSYLEAAQAAYAAGGRIIIVDSASHMHEGDGGILDMHDALLDKFAGDDEKKREKNNMRAWIEPKKELGQTVNTLLNIDAHFIFCFRAQEKVKPIGGKPQSIGIQPIASDRLIYEMVLRLILPGEVKGVPDLSASATKLPEPLIPMMKQGARITQDFGWMLAKWARGDEPETKPGPALIAAPIIEQDQEQPSSPDAPEEAPPESSQEGGASNPPVSSSLRSYHDELSGAHDEDELKARHEGSWNFSALKDDEKPVARQLYKLHLRRVIQDIGKVAFREEIEELLT
jgi:hypothetical protein